MLLVYNSLISFSCLHMVALSWLSLSFLITCLSMQSSTTLGTLNPLMQFTLYMWCWGSITFLLHTYIHTVFLGAFAVTSVHGYLSLCLINSSWRRLFHVSLRLTSQFKEIYNYCWWHFDNLWIGAINCVLVGIILWVLKFHSILF